MAVRAPGRKQVQQHFRPPKAGCRRSRADVRGLGMQSAPRASERREPARLAYIFCWLWTAVAFTVLHVAMYVMREGSTGR